MYVASKARLFGELIWLSPSCGGSVDVSLTVNKSFKRIKIK